jgi:transposase
MMRIGHYRPVHVKSAEAQLIRTTLQARRQMVAMLLQIQGSIRGLLRMHGLKVGDIHRNRFDKRVRELLEEMPLLNVAIEPLLRVPGTARHRTKRRWTNFWAGPPERTRFACG